MERIEITLSNGRLFGCPLNAWLDSGPSAAGPSTRLVNCHNHGTNVVRLL